MKSILCAKDRVLKILGNKNNLFEGEYRFIKYCIRKKVDNGEVLFNLLTRELLFVENGDWGKDEFIQEMKRKWFLVPLDCDEKKYVNIVRQVERTLKAKDKCIVNYTIFTTTDCNARCFYCFEHGSKRISMSNETAKKVVDYITNHSMGHKVHIRWFGGEPLFNKNAIDIISEGLIENKIEFDSSMVSNGFLFDSELVNVAINKWKLKQVQITLDGTEMIYNKSKAFIYNNVNAYERVIANIVLLTNSGINVLVRLNINSNNGSDLVNLVDFLDKQVINKKFLKIYSHTLYENVGPVSDSRSDEERKHIYQEKEIIDKAILEKGLERKRNIRGNVVIRQCMADSGNSITVLPDGNIGLCEHFLETEFVGDLNGGITDLETVASWKKYRADIDDCNNCCLYPECLRPEKCQEIADCHEETRKVLYNEIVSSMEYEYSSYLSNCDVEYEEYNEC